MIHLCTRQPSGLIGRKSFARLPGTKTLIAQSRHQANALPIANYRSRKIHNKADFIPSFTNFPRNQHAQSRRLIAGLPVELIVLTCDPKHLCCTFQGGKRLAVTMKSRRRAPPSQVEMDKFAQTLIHMLQSTIKGKSLVFCVSSFNLTMQLFVQAIWGLRDPTVEFTVDIRKVGEIYARWNASHTQVNSVTDLCKLFRISAPKPIEQGADHKKRCAQLIEQGVAVRKCLKRLRIASGQKTIETDTFLTSLWRIILVRSRSKKETGSITVEFLVTDSGELTEFTGSLSEVILSIAEWVAGEQFHSIGKEHLFAFSSSAPHADVRKALVNLPAEFAWIRFVCPEFSKIIESEQSLESAWEACRISAGGVQRAYRAFIHDACYRSSKYHIRKQMLDGCHDNCHRGLWPAVPKGALPLGSKGFVLI